MNITLSNDPEPIDWERLAVVFQRAPLGTREPGRLRQLFLNSGLRCFVHDGSELIGAGRAITDGLRYTVIFDVVVLPEYQGQGLGRQIMTYLAAQSKAANLMLHSVPGKEPFYEKLGFRKMKTAMARFADPDGQQKAGYIE